MKILYAAAEMVPFAKVGGLADVAGALTEQLARAGHDVHALLPVYPSVRKHWDGIAPKKVGELSIALGTETHRGTLHQATLAESGVKLLLIEYDPFFDRPNPYVDPETGSDWPDNAQRFAFLSHALLAGCEALDLSADVVHLNDYQVGLVALLLRSGRPPRVLREAATLYSIHNMGYQGIFPLDEKSAAPEKKRGPGVDPANGRLADLVASLGLPSGLSHPGGPLEFHHRLNYMKAGLVSADLISTVSPTYAREIQTPEMGFGLDGVLRERADRLVGILNGIDDAYWNPATDALIPHNYGPSDFGGKRENKARLLEASHLPPDLGVPLIGMIGRLVDQKGLDLFERIADAFLKKNEVRVVVLGSGMPRYEELMSQLAKEHPERFAVRLGFDEPLAHLIEAGSDFFLMPSRYEPCGLNQMYSMRYGSVPIVRATGGLADTVTEFRPGAGTGTGFVFEEYTPEALQGAMDRALAAFGKTRAFKSLVTRIMRLDFSWGKARGEYEQAYQRAIRLRRNELGLPGTGSREVDPARHGQ
jgi:starch synthase